MIKDEKPNLELKRQKIRHIWRAEGRKEIPEKKKKMQLHTVMGQAFLEVESSNPGSITRKKAQKCNLCFSEKRKKYNVNT